MKKTKIFLMIGIMFAIVMGLSGCMDIDLYGGGGGDSDSKPPEPVHPSILYIEPDSGGGQVPINRSILFEFSNTMDPATVSNETVSLKSGSLAVSGTVTAADNLRDFTFTPTQGLAPNTEYTFRVSTGVKNGGGLSMLDEFTSTFSTGDFIDSMPPTVITTWFGIDGTGSWISPNISATLSEIMDPISFDASSFHLTTGGVEVPCDIYYDPIDSKVVFYLLEITEYPDGMESISNPSLAFGTTYMATLSGAFRDLAGNALGEYSWSFTTPL